MQNITPDIANTLCSVCANICNNNKSKKSYLNCSFFQTTSVDATAHIFWPLWMMHRGRMQLKKKIIFFQDAYQEVSNVWYEKMKKKTSCILSFSPTQCRHKMFFNFKNQWSRKDLVLNISPLALVYLYGMTYHFFRITRYILGVRAEQKFLFGQEGKQTQ